MKTRFLLLLLISGYYAHSQQIMHFTKYWEQQLYYNPGAAGSLDCAPLQVNLQIMPLKENYSGGNNYAENVNPAKLLITAHVPFSDQRMGLGLNIYNDRFGINKTTGITPAYAYHIQFDEDNRMGLGIGLSMFQYMLDKTNLSFYDPNDPVVTTGKEMDMVFALNPGVFAYGKN